MLAAGKEGAEQMHPQRCLVMFAKYPAPGKVKTRLSPHFPEEMIVRLYRAFIEDLLARLAHGDYEFRFAYHPPDREEDFRRDFGDNYTYLPQTGGQLGEKMAGAFRACFAEGFREVVLIGSDSPDLPREIIGEAFGKLSDHGAVLGPADDGGYYLIGFRREAFTARVFTGIAWGGKDVAAKTLAILAREETRVHVLPLWRDIDAPADLAALIAAGRKRDFTGSRTMACLHDYGLIAPA